MSNPWLDVRITPDGPEISTSVTPQEAAVLMRYANGRDCLEIGSAFGFSAITMARADASSVVAVDSHWNSNSNQWKDTLPVMLSNLDAYGVTGKVTILKLPSEEALPALVKQGKKFGLIFVDADHSREAVLHDVSWAKQLLTEDGVIACHDYGLHGIETVTCAVDDLFPEGPDEFAGTLFVTRLKEKAQISLSGGDLLLIVPSRGRPDNITRLLDAVHSTSRLKTHVRVAIDYDDPESSRYEYAFSRSSKDGDILHYGPRMGLASWTNEIATGKAKDYPYLASVGDDMVPRTPGWDRALVQAIERMGGTGFSYPWDSLREDIPEMCVISSDIVRELGWFCLPDLKHFFIDNVWADLGHGANCIRHCRSIDVEHVHPRAGKATGDKTYTDSSDKLIPDRDAYYRWKRDGRMAQDIKTIAVLREKIAA